MILTLKFANIEINLWVNQFLIINMYIRRACFFDKNQVNLIVYKKVL